jgi:hypothetical protein
VTAREVGDRLREVDCERSSGASDTILLDSHIAKPTGT